MSRAINLNLAQAEVVARCHEAGVSISAIETLPSGGTHLVTMSGDGAIEMRALLRKHLIEGRVQRFAFMPQPTQRVTQTHRLAPRPGNWQPTSSSAASTR